MDEHDTDETLEHIIRKHIEPTLAAADLREELAAQGISVETAIVNVNPAAEGFTVTCGGCGRTAKLSVDPGSKVGLCSTCAVGLRRRRGH